MPDLDDGESVEMKGSGPQALRPEEHRRRLLLHLPGLAEPVDRRSSGAPASTCASSAATRPRRRRIGGACRRPVEGRRSEGEDASRTAAAAGRDLGQRRRPGRLVDEREARRRAGLLGRQAVPLAAGQPLPRAGLVRRRAARRRRSTASCGSTARRSSARSASSAGRTRATTGRRSRFVVFDAPAHRRAVRGAAGVRCDERWPRSTARRSRWSTSISCADEPRAPARGAGPRRGARRRGADAAAAGLARTRPGRSATLLKVKTFHDAEARVVGHLPGAGRHKGRLGALVGRAARRHAVLRRHRLLRRRAREPAAGRQHDHVPLPGAVRRRRAAVSVVRRRAGRRASRRRAGEDQPGDKLLPDPKHKSAVGTSINGSQQEQRPWPDTSSSSKATSSKFWEISQDGNDVTVRFGKIGTHGQTQTKTFDDAAAAQKHAEKLIGEKTKKGYVES